MCNLKLQREKKLLNVTNPDFSLIREMIDQSVSFVDDHTEVISVEVVSMDDIFGLLPEEILSINDCYIQKIAVFKNNFIAIGKWMEDEAKLYTIMFASTKPDAFIYDVKNDFGIDIKR